MGIISRTHINHPNKGNNFTKEKRLSQVCDLIKAAALEGNKEKLIELISEHLEYLATNQNLLTINSFGTYHIPLPLHNLVITLVRADYDCELTPPNDSKVFQAACVEKLIWMCNTYRERQGTNIIPECIQQAEKFALLVQNDKANNYFINDYVNAYSNKYLSAPQPSPHSKYYSGGYHNTGPLVSVTQSVSTELPNLENTSHLNVALEDLYANQAIREAVFTSKAADMDEELRNLFIRHYRNYSSGPVNLEIHKKLAAKITAMLGPDGDDIFRRLITRLCPQHHDFKQPNEAYTTTHEPSKITPPETMSQLIGGFGFIEEKEI